MHDPMTVAFEIKSPFKSAPRSAYKIHDEYRSTIIRIWHVDPERDGSDDSCGWSWVKLTESQRERLKSSAWFEGRDPYFQCVRDKQWRGTRHEAEAMYRGLVIYVADVLRIDLTYDQAAKFAARKIHHADCVDDAGVLCFLPGYHSNSAEDRRSDREERFTQTMMGIARELLTARRPWYRHPRWHFWHWKIQIIPVQDFKRWAFSRCERCHQRFDFGEAPVASSWNRGGPRWFRGETGLTHSRCYKAYEPVTPPAAEAHQ